MTLEIEAARRLNPRWWDSDFVLLREMASAYGGLVRSNFRRSRDLTIVDFGCGDMPYRQLLAPYCKRYIGADFEGNAVADMVIAADGSLDVPSESADVVVSSQVLEHVTDVQRYLRECHRVLKADGALLLSTHGNWIYHPHPVDVRRWTFWGLRFELEQSGFRLAASRACLGPLAYSTQLRMMLVKGLFAKLGGLGRILSMPLCVCYQALMCLQEWLTPMSVRHDNASVYVVLARKAPA